MYLKYEMFFFEKTSFKLKRSLKINFFKKPLFFFINIYINGLLSRYVCNKHTNTGNYIVLNAFCTDLFDFL